MSHARRAALGFALAVLFATGCGGGSGSTPAAPVLVAVVPAQGSTSGGTPLILTGSNFVGGASVTVGGGAALGVVVVNSTTITCFTPPGLPGTVAVSVTTSGGASILPLSFTYVPPVLYGADGKTGPTVAAAVGNLWNINPTNGLSFIIAPIGGPTGITGMALAPNGVMWISECDAGVSNDAVGTIHLGTGVATAVGNTGQNALSDMTFVGSVLIAHTNSSDRDIVSVNTTTGVATTIAAGPECCGNGLAADAFGNVYLATASAGLATIPNLYLVNPLTGMTTFIAPISGLTYNRINSMTFLAGTLYAVDSAFATNNVLGTINTTTGAFTAIGAIPGAIDAIEGSVR